MSESNFVYYVEEDTRDLDKVLLGDQTPYRIVIQNDGLKLTSDNIMSKSEANQRLHHLIVTLFEELSEGVY